MGRLNEGQNMPDFSFRTPFCPKLTLKEFMAGQKTAIVFLRYFGCTLCQYDMAQYAAGYEEIKAAGGKLLVVLQSDPELLAQDLGTEDAMPFTIACDTEGELYREYGILPAESKMKMAGAKTVVKLAKATAAGYKHGRYEGEELQLPAAFVVDGNGTITWAHYGTTADDVPDVDKLAGYLRKASC
ncbi:MAG: AhpC/TSA family protein [Hungatella hathewayi]|nr:AhpC/TSA family protein [Hungatella hathewayi]